MLNKFTTYKDTRTSDTGVQIFHETIRQFENQRKQAPIIRTVFTAVLKLLVVTQQRTVRGRLHDKRQGLLVAGCMIKARPLHIKIHLRF